MPRPTSKPKLSRIDPYRLAQDLTDYVFSCVKMISADLALPPPEAAPSFECPIAKNVMALVEYARYGREARDAYGVAAWVSLSYYEPYLAEGSPLALAVALIRDAAHARRAITQDQPVSVRDLGLLADLDDKQTRRVLADLGLKVKDGVVTARAAKRFLAKRAESGYVPVLQRTG